MISVKNLNEALSYALKTAVETNNNYAIFDKKGNYVYVAKAAAIIQSNSEEELVNMDWDLYADEIINALNLDEESESYTVKFDSK